MRRWASRLTGGALRPEEYDRLTPEELADVLDGATYEIERQRRDMAWALAHVLNISGKVLKRPVTADDLLRPPAPPGSVDEDAFARKLAEHKRRQRAAGRLKEA